MRTFSYHQFSLTILNSTASKPYYQKEESYAMDYFRNKSFHQCLPYISINKMKKVKKYKKMGKQQSSALPKKRSF